VAELADENYFTCSRNGDDIDPVSGIDEIEVMLAVRPGTDRGGFAHSEYPAIG